MNGFQGLPPLAEVQEAAPPGGFQGGALTRLHPGPTVEKGVKAGRVTNRI